jgi:hypothetical protein
MWAVDRGTEYAVVRQAQNMKTKNKAASGLGENCYCILRTGVTSISSVYCCVSCKELLEEVPLRLVRFRRDSGAEESDNGLFDGMSEISSEREAGKDSVKDSPRC